MGYDRKYTREEIHQMLYLSERRTRPTNQAHAGHAISRHTEQRKDKFDRRGIAQDTTFSSRKDLVLAVEEALHDPLGQSVLSTLNSRPVETCAITFSLSATFGKIKADVVLNPMAIVKKKKVGAQGPQYFLAKVLVSSIFVLVDKLAAPESWAPLHIHTAYPKDFIK